MKEYRNGEPPYKKHSQNKLEKWLDRHNHTMEAMRTIFSFAGVLTGCVIFLKVFGLI